MKSTLLVLFVNMAIYAQQFADSLVVDEMDVFHSLTSEWEFIPDFDYYEVGERLSRISSEIPLVYNESVKGFIDYFTVRNRAYTKEIIKKHAYYFPLFEAYLAKYGLPDELKYLAIIESGLNPKAVSRAGAVGMWQFMPRTARMEFGLTEDWYIDEKMDIYKATDAACRYLAFLYNTFGDWEMALAAYNSGPGNVRKAIRLSGYKKTFWEVYPYLKRETRSYVPQFVAMIYTMHYADEYNFDFSPGRLPNKVDTVFFSDFVMLKDIETVVGRACYDELKNLNPELKKSVIPPYAKNYPLKVPAHLADTIKLSRDLIVARSSLQKEEFEKMAENTPGSVYGREKITHSVKSGEVLGKIAATYGVRVSDIQSWNNLKGTTIYVGQKLNIWVLPTFKNQQIIASSNQPAAAKQNISNNRIDSDATYYIVQKGDTLWDISRKFDGLTIDDLKRMNNLKSTNIQPGMQLKVANK